MRKFFRKLYKLIDVLIVVPISRLIYNIQKALKKNGGLLDKLLNKPNFLIFLSLILAIVLFLLVDSKAISFVEDKTEVISNVPVNIKYNEEAYVVEGAPTDVNIMISGRKSDIYLAKQLGEYEVTLDLTEYTASDTAYKVYFTYAKSINNLKYSLDPSYVQVMIKNKVSSVSSVTYELINQDKLDSKLSVKSIGLSKSEVVVKGSESALKKIAWIKALVDLSNPDFVEAGSYDIDNIALVAYDNAGKLLNNVEIVPSTLSATVVLDSYSENIPVEVKTTGNLISGKSIAKILINNNNDYSITAYGNEEDISKIKSIPITINVDGLGGDTAKTYNVTLTKPNGVRYMSASTITVSLTFGNEEQKTVELTNISKKNLGSGLTANIISDSAISVICKGVASSLDKVDVNNIKAYVDLSGLGAGDHDVEVKIENLKVRKEPDRNSAILKEAKNGEVFKVDDYENHNGNYWYHIEYEKERWGWIANPLGDEYLNDENNPEDIKSPTIKFFDKIYYVDSIDDINYDHLEVKDDKQGVKVTHKVYHEVDETEGKDQYWILYIATDAVGKTTKKVQKRPDETKVFDFSKLEEDRK